MTAQSHHQSMKFVVLHPSNIESHQDGYRLVSVRTHGAYSAAPLGDQVTSTMTWYPTQSHYPDTDLTSLCPNLIMPNAWLGNDGY